MIKKLEGSVFLTTKVCERITELEKICARLEDNIKNYNGFGSMFKMRELLKFTRETMKINMLVLRKIHPDLYRQMTLVRQ